MAGEVPNNALANSLWTGVGEVEDLADLTWIEEKLIARVHVSIQLQKCRLLHQWRSDGFYPQPRIRGHVVTFPVDPTVVLYHLPLHPQQLSGLIKVAFIGRKKITWSDASTLRFFLVRRIKVRHALEWLLQYNLLYRDVCIDYECLAQLPEHGMIEELFKQATFDYNQRREDAMHSRYDAPDPESSNGSDIAESDMEKDCESAFRKKH
jgi:hypothetical protein